MRRSFVTLAVAGLVALTSACGSDAGSDPAPVDDATPTTVATAGGGAGDAVGSVGDAVQVAAGAPGQASDAACAADRQTLETAAELYLGLNGVLPPSQAALVDAQLIRELSSRFEIAPDGAIVAAPGSPCP
jgi:hypothetical protein